MSKDGPRLSLSSSEPVVRKTETPEGKIGGTIKRWNAEKGFGFLRLHDGREVFCHVTQLCEHIRPSRGQAPEIGSSVNVKKINQNERGLAAEGVECDECAVPEQWELQPFGDEVFGAREIRPVCVNKSGVFSSRSPISSEEVERANVPFELAKRKKTLWEYAIVGDEFFNVFGEPQSIRVEDESKIVLSYPHGEITVSTDSAMYSGHWEVSPSGSWKEDGESIKAEFIFPDMPGAKTWGTVALLHINPSLSGWFELLSENTKQEVLAKVKEKILPPEDIAEKHFNDFLNDDYEKGKISKLRDDLRFLQAPGESYVSSSKRRTQVYDPLSPDERSGDSYRDADVTSYSLTVGARKKERDDWRGNYKGGKNFEVSSGEN